jgi:hypothetical protein
MLKCRDVVEQADAYLATELSSWQRFQYNLHLMVCGYCRRYIKSFKLTQKVSEQLPIASTPSDMELSALVKMIQQDNQQAK